MWAALGQFVGGYFFMTMLAFIHAYTIPNAAIESSVPSASRHERYVRIPLSTLRSVQLMRVLGRMLAWTKRWKQT
jgi:hypothetical protein